ncbi:MAG: hypothetical protein AAFY08_14045 [Planctomycetota bacterium]
MANDADFSVPGDDRLSPATCPHPRATGDPGHDVNCGCTTLARYPGDDVKAVLARYAARGFVTLDQLNRKDAA